MKKATYILGIMHFALFISPHLLAQVTTKLEWVKQLGLGETSSVSGHSIAVDASGNVYTLGDFSSYIDFDPGTGIYNLYSGNRSDIFILKLDTNGNFVWAKQFEGSSHEYGMTLSVDVKCNVYSIGYFNETTDFDPGSGTFDLTAEVDADIFISKLDSSGNFIWARQLKGTFKYYTYGIDVDKSGNVYTTGNFIGTADFDPGTGVYYLTAEVEEDVFILKLDSSGNFVWAKQIGGSNREAGCSISVDASCNIYTTGSFIGTADFDPGPGIFNMTSIGADCFISKLNASGNFEWAKQLGDYAEDSFVDASSNVYTTGEFFGTNDFDPGPGIYNLYSKGSTDIFISKLDANGNFVWAKQLGGYAEDNAGSIFVDDFGNVYTIGNFEETADFDPGTDAYYFNSTGYTDIYISKLDVNGNFLWAKQFSGTSYDKKYIGWGNSIFVDTWNNVYTTGGFLETVDFDPDIGICNLTSIGYEDIFIHKMSQNTSVMINDYSLVNNFSLYPNPFSSQTQINFELSVSSNVRIAIYDINGREVKILVNSKFLPGTYSALWDGKNNSGGKVPSGIHFLQMRAGDFVGHDKIIFVE